MAKKVKSKPMHEILKRLSYFAFLEIVIFEEEVNTGYNDFILHYYAYVMVIYFFFAIFETSILSMTFPGGAVRLQLLLGGWVGKSCDFE